MFPRIPPGTPPPAYEMPPSYQAAHRAAPPPTPRPISTNAAENTPAMAPLGVEGGYEDELQVYASPSPAPIGDSSVHGIAPTHTETTAAETSVTPSTFTRADDTFTPVVATPVPRRLKRPAAALATPDASDAAPPANASAAIDFELYAHVNIPVKAKAGSRGKQTPKPVTQKFGPLTLKSNVTWDEFLRAIASLVSSSSHLLAVDTFEWRFTKPKNSSLFPLRAAAALVSMLSQVDKKIAKDSSVFVILEMSPPAVVQQQNLPWTSSASGSSLASMTAHASHEDNNDDEGPAPKKARYDDEVEEIIEKLKEKYPPGRCTDHPNLCCFSLGPAGLHFELNRMRCIVWAAAIRKNHATLDKAPISKDIFNPKHALPRANASAPVAPATPQPSNPPFPQALGFPPFNPYYMTPPPFFGMGMPMHPMMPQFTPPSSHAGYTHPAMPSSLSEARGSSPPLPECEIADFCRQYNLDKSIEISLETLKFRVGDNMRAVPSEEWKAAGFTFLSWERTCKAYDKYRRSARSN